MALKDNIDHFLEAHDMSPADASSFLFIHTVLSAILVSSTWYVCYVAAGSCAPPPPTKIPSSLSNAPPPPKSILLNALLSSSFVPESMQRRAYLSLVSMEQASRNSKVVKFVQRTFPSIDATRLVLSFAEAKFGRLFFKPITIPGRIWLSWKGAKAWRSFRERYGTSEDFVSSSLPSLQHMGDKAYALFPAQHKPTNPKMSPRLVAMAPRQSSPFICPLLKHKSPPISPFHTPCF